MADDFRRQLMMLLASRPKGPIVPVIEYIEDKTLRYMSGELTLADNPQYTVVHITNLDPTKSYTIYCPLGAGRLFGDETMGKDVNGNLIRGSVIDATANFTSSSGLTTKPGIMKLPSGIKELWTTWYNIGNNNFGYIHKPCDECFALRESTDTEPIEMWFNASGMYNRGLLLQTNTYHNYYMMYNVPTGDVYFPASAWAESSYYTTVCVYKKSLGRFDGYTNADMMVTSYYDNSDGDVSAILVQLPDT